MNTSTGIGIFTQAENGELPGLYENLLDFVRQREPELHVFEEPVNARQVLDDVRSLIKRFPQGSRRPALFGVPVGIKALYRTEGYSIRCGSLLPRDLFEGAEAELVQRLRRAGAVILGMTATTEFAHSAPAATCNPRNYSHTPGGSSSGSAAGVAAGYFPLALGTQTLGSVIRPAAYCGIPGFKPSHGRLSTAGFVPFSVSADQPGFFCTSIADMAPVLEVLTADAWKTEADMPGVPAEIHLGLPEGPLMEQLSASAGEEFEKAVHRISKACQELPVRFCIQRVSCMDDYDALVELHTAMAAAEASAYHAPWFDRYRHLYRPRTLELLERGRALQKTGSMERGRESMAAFRAQLTSLMDKNALDAWICPSALNEAEQGLDSTGSPGMNIPWTHAGLPVLTIPYGHGPEGLPLGLQLAGRFGKDEQLLKMGEAVARHLRAVD